jgi:DNA-binding PadR family transcriptional regulator
VATIVDEKRERKSTGFMIRQRAFLKLYLITYVEKSGSYGFQSWEQLKDEFEQYGFVPQHPEIYRALHDLMEDGILVRKKIKKEGARYQEVAVYYMNNKEEAKAYKKLVKHDLDRCIGILTKAVRDNY